MCIRDSATRITGEVLYVDGGYNIMGAPDPELMEGGVKGD